MEQDKTGSGGQLRKSGDITRTRPSQHHAQSRYFSLQSTLPAIRVATPKPPSMRTKMLSCCFRSSLPTRTQLSCSQRFGSSIAGQDRENLVILGSGWGGYNLLKSIDKAKYNVTLIRFGGFQLSSSKHGVTLPTLAQDHILI